MKKLTLIVTILIGAYNLQAQDMGTIFFNGASNLSYSFSDGKPFEFDAGVGYFVVDNIMAGINIEHVNYSGSDNTIINLMARYYINQNLFGGVRYSLEGDHVISLQAGYELFLSDNIALEPTFFYYLEDNYDPEIKMGVSIFFNR